jgi:chaperonin GroES
MNVKPLNDRVLVKRLESEDRSAGGIIIPDTAKEKPQEGRVVATGPGKLEKGERLPISVKVGDRVLFGKYAGTEVNIGGEEHTLLREDEIFAIFEP